MILPDTTFDGQIVAICNRYIKLYQDEHNSHPLRAVAKSLRAEFDAVVPEQYHKHKLIWLVIKWDDVIHGNKDLNFPGLNLDIRAAAFKKRDEAYQALRVFAKWQREEHNPTVKKLAYERHKAMELCRNDPTHKPTLSDFTVVNGRVKLSVPASNSVNEATNIAFAMRAFEKIPNMTEDQREAVFEAMSEAKQAAYLSDHWDKKLDKELVRTNVNMPEPPDPLVDYTEPEWVVKEVNNEFDITTNTITVTLLRRNVDVWVVKDFGVGYFNNSLTHTNAIKYTGASADYAVGVVWMLSNIVDDVNYVRLNSDCIYSYLVKYPDGTCHASIGEASAGVVITDEVTGIALNTQYYNDYEIDYDIGTYGTALLRVYNDVDKITLHGNAGILLQGPRVDYRNLFAVNSYNAPSYQDISFIVSNLDLQEAVDRHSNSYYGNREVFGNYALNRARRIY